MSVSRLLVIQHEDDAPPAWFGEWLAEVGVELDVVHAYRGDAVPADLGTYDGLIVLGGAMGAYDDATHPWLTPTKELITTAVAAGRFFFGICLGHQLGAVALGGQVEVNPLGQANGLTVVSLTDEGRGDDVLSAVVAGARSVQWNDDIVTRLPEGGVVLATSPDGTIQAARFAPTAWGIQFHPEASPEVFARWIASVDPHDSATYARLQTTLATIAEAEPDLRRHWEPLARRLAEVIAARPRVP